MIRRYDLEEWARILAQKPNVLIAWRLLGLGGKKSKCDLKTRQDGESERRCEKEELQPVSLVQNA